MSDFKIKYLFLFVALVLFQVLILDHIHFLGYINPYLYVAFIILLPLKTNRTYLLVSAFLLGLFIDMFNDTGGVHAGACVAVAYIRHFIIRLSFGINYDLNIVKLISAKIKTQIIFIFLMTFFHHLVMFSLSYFSINYSVDVLINTIYSSIFSSLLIFLILNLIKK